MLGSKRFWLLSVASVVVSFVIVVAVAQFILHAIFDNQQIRTQISKTLENQGYLFLSDERIRKSWFPAPNITLYNVSVSDYKNTVFTAQRVNVRFSSALLLGNKKIEKITFNQPEFFIKKHPNGKWNVAQFSLNTQNQNTPNRLLFTDGVLNIEDGNQQYRMEHIRLTGENISDNGVIHGMGDWVNKTNLSSVPIQFHSLLRYDEKNLFLQDISGSLKTPLPYFGETDIQWRLPHLRYYRQQNSIETRCLWIVRLSPNCLFQ